MASNMECLGLAVADVDDLITSALASATLIGTVDGVDVHRWQDPSGVRLMLATRNGDVVDLLPSFAGGAGVRLGGMRLANDDVIIANVQDESGQTITMLAAELEERRLLPADPPGCVASVVALGTRVTVHATAAEFTASPASLLSPDRPGSPHMGPVSFLSYGVFGPPENAQAYARLHGTVVHAERRTVAATGQTFIATRVRSVFEVDLCVPGSEFDLPEPGSIIGGDVFLTASFQTPG